MPRRTKAELIEWLEAFAVNMEDDGDADQILGGLLSYRDRHDYCSRKTCKKPATGYKRCFPWCDEHYDKAVFLCSRDGCEEPGEHWRRGKRVCWTHKAEAAP